MANEISNTFSGDNNRLKEACDRALEYVREMNLPPEESLEMILAGLKEIGPAAGIEEIMSDLWRRLDESDSKSRFSDLPSDHCAAAPPLNRCCMISEGLDISLSHMLFRIVAGGFKPLKKLVSKRPEDSAAAGKSANWEATGGRKPQDLSETTGSSYER